MEHSSVLVQLFDSSTLTTGPASRELHVSENHLRRLADTGVLPCRRLPNGMRLFERAAIERLRIERERIDWSDPQ